MSISGAVPIARTRFWNRVTWRGTYRNSCRIEVVAHHAEVIGLEVVAGVSAVKRAQIMSQLMHGDASPRLIRDHNTVIYKKAKRDDGVIAKDLAGALGISGRRAASAAFRIGRTSPTIQSVIAGTEVAEHHVVVGEFD